MCNSNVEDNFYEPGSVWLMRERDRDGGEKLRDDVRCQEEVRALCVCV